MSFIDEKFLDKKYYLNSMSLYLKQSFGMKERMQIFINLLKQLEETGDEIFNKLNIFDPDYEEDNPTWATSTESYWLDIIGDMIGLKRQVVTNVTSETNPAPQRFTLTNYEYLIYLQIMIVKNVFDGSNETLLLLYNGSTNKYYDVIMSGAGEASYGSEVSDWQNFVSGEVSNNYKAKDLKMIYLSNVDNGLSTQVISIDNSLTEKLKPHLYYLFKDKKFIIDSLGITYFEPAITDNIKIGKLGKYFRCKDYFRNFALEYYNSNGIMQIQYFTFDEDDCVILEDWEIEGETYNIGNFNDPEYDGHYQLKYVSTGSDNYTTLELKYRFGGTIYEIPLVDDFALLPDSAFADEGSDDEKYSAMMTFANYQVLTLLGSQEEATQDEV